MALGCHLKTQIMGPRGGSSGGSSGAGVPSRSTQTEEKDGGGRKKEWRRRYYGCYKYEWFFLYLWLDFEKVLIGSNKFF